MIDHNHGSGGIGINVFEVGSNRFEVVNNTIALNFGVQVYLATDSGIHFANNIVAADSGRFSVQCYRGARHKIRFDHNLVFAGNGATIANCRAEEGGLLTDDPPIRRRRGAARLMARLRLAGGRRR